MSTPGAGAAPAGVRQVTSGSVGSGLAAGVGRLRWVAAGPFELAPGDRVAVRENDREWLGEVVVPPERLVEWLEQTELPVAERRVADAEWPNPPVTEGRRLLESLNLAPKLLARWRPGHRHKTG